MTRGHLEKVLRYYQHRWASHYAPERLETEDLFPSADRSKAMKHAMWMCERSLEFLREERFEKAYIWLGFIQGTFWACGHYSIDEMRAHSTEATEP